MQEIALIGFIQTLFFSLLIATKKKKETKDYLLVICLLFVGAELIYRYLLKTIPESDKWIVFFDITYWALFGPVTMMYILFTINIVKKFRAVHLLHLFVLIIGMYAIKDFFFGNVEYGSFIEYFNGSIGITKAALYCWEFCSPIYIVYSLYILIKHKKSIKDYFSDISKNDLKWLFILLTGFAIYLLISYGAWFMADVFHVRINFNSLEILPAILTAYVFFIGYFGYKQAGIFFDYPDKKNGLKHKHYENSGDKYKKSGLSEIEHNELIIRLKEVMETEKPFIESDLNINILAKMLNTSFHKLSQVINESFNQNFYSFINTHRIEESKHLLKRPENEKYTIISIAYDCGFSSKSSFYNAFKQNTGITPQEYLNQQKHIDPR